MINILEQLKKEYRSLLSGMGMSARKAGDLIGLDIGSGYFRAVRIKTSGDSFTVQDKVIGKTDELINLAAKLSVKDEEGFSINFNSEGAIAKRVSVPVIPQEEIPGALKWELKEQSGFDIEKASIKYTVLGEKEGEDGARKIDLIAFAYQEPDIESQVKQLKGMGLNVQSVTPLDFALAKYVSAAKAGPADEKIAIVDIGSVKTVISIIENSRVYFTREILVGGDAITEAMTGVFITDKGRMELSGEDAENMKKEQGISSDIKILSLIRPVLEKLASQIRSSLEYCESKFSCTVVKKIILAGNGSRLKGLAEYLHREAGLEVLAILPEEAGAIGLALSRDSSVNMLPEKYKAEDKKALKRFSVTMIGFVAAVIVALSYMLLCVQAINMKKELDVQRHYWDNLKEIRILKNKIITYGSAINTVSANSINAGRLMKEISNIILPNMALDRLTINYQEPNISMGGVVYKQDSLTEFMSKLESNPMFNNVKLSFSEKSRDSLGGDVINFGITCSIRKK
ncbi:MAG: pilus assembly protein PilM [Candidatus Omnitrophota bacterium]|nr:pilus assembly protein PilM [Candidatus Omnitrophota bacterium]